MRKKVLFRKDVSVSKLVAQLRANDFSVSPYFLEELWKGHPNKYRYIKDRLARGPHRGIDIGYIESKYLEDSFVLYFNPEVNRLRNFVLTLPKRR